MILTMINFNNNNLACATARPNRSIELWFGYLCSSLSLTASLPSMKTEGDTA